MLNRIDHDAWCRRALDLLAREGFSAAECFVCRASTLALELHYGRLTRPLYTGEQGARVRALAGGTLAECFLDDLSERGLPELVRMLRSAGRPAPAGFAFAPPPAEPLPQVTHFDAAALEVPLEEKWSLVRRLTERTMAQNFEVKAVAVAVYRQTLETVAYRNSRGAALDAESSVFTLAVDAAAQKGERVGRGTGVTWACHYAALAPDDAAELAAETARLRLFDANAVAPGRHDALFRPSASALLATLAAAYLAGTIGAPPDGAAVRFADGFTVLDNPRLPLAPGSAPFDCEGTPTRTVTLIDSGTPGGTRLIDRLEAATTGAAPTGAARIASLAGKRGTATSNLYLAPADALVDPPSGPFLEITHLEIPPDFWGADRTLKLSAAGYAHRPGAAAAPFSALALHLSLDAFPAPIRSVGSDLRFFPQGPRGVHGGPSLLCTGVETRR